MRVILFASLAILIGSSLGALSTLLASDRAFLKGDVVCLYDGLDLSDRQRVEEVTDTAYEIQRIFRFDRDQKRQTVPHKALNKFVLCGGPRYKTGE